MGQISLVRVCGYCNGKGSRVYNESPGGPLITEDPCAMCGGDGKTTSPNGIDDTLFQNILEELDYIHKRVRKIWLKVKDEGDEE